MTGKIFDIQRFSVFDGPGARTVVFFKGCNLRCKWCHNPESYQKKTQRMHFPERCIGCGRCLEACPEKSFYFDENRNYIVDKEKCTNCNRCVDACYSRALVTVGKDMTTEELFDEILVDYEYYVTANGGVTFSGGECMLQIDFLIEVLKLCKERKIHTAIDTAGNVPWEYFERINDYVDVFLYDVKAANSDVHRQLTGVGNEQIIENLKRLCGLKKKVIVRVPFVIGGNEKEQQGIIGILKKLQLEYVEVLAYHNMGNSKYRLVDMEIKPEVFSVPSDEEMNSFKNALAKEGIPVI